MSKQSEQERLLALSERDRAFWTQDGVILAGMDEVGRGPLAGPVVVACVVMPPEPLLEYVNDSKKVSEKRREALYDRILSTCIEAQTAWVDQTVIDEINILEATKLAMRKAVESLDVEPDALLIDALSIPSEVPVTSLVHGDALSLSIGAASIIAKEYRDDLMRAYDAEFPGYGFASNMGYGSAAHIEALRTIGPCPIHRRSFITHFVS